MNKFDNIRIFYTEDIPDDYYGEEESTTVGNFLNYSVKSLKSMARDC